jgi:HK97 family phage prohead protease
VLSQGGVARDGHCIDPDGWILPSSGEVPLLDAHRDGQGISSILGRVKHIRGPDEGGKTADGRPALVGTLVMATTPAADTAGDLISAGFIDSVSVSFFPRAWKPAHDRGTGAMDISSAELLEVSLVPVPADVDAKILGRALARSARGSALTRAERAAIAQAYAVRIAREDGLGLGTREERAARARALIGNDVDDLELRRRLLE